MNVTKQLYQWDTGQKLTECTGIYVDYLIGSEVYRVEVKDGTCIIPDELLQTSGRYKVWECMADNTLREFAFKVLPRPTPPNYVFTPTEQLTFEGLVQKETNKFNTNAIEKLNAYNANADNRVAEFNAQTEQIQADVSELKSDLTSNGLFVSLMVKKVENLNCPSNSTSYESANSYDTYYVPMDVGVTYKITIDTTAEAMRVAHSSSIPANGVPCDFEYEITITDGHISLDYSATSQGYLSVSLYRKTGTIVKIEENRNDGIINDIKNDILGYNTQVPTTLKNLDLPLNGGLMSIIRHI